MTDASDACYYSLRMTQSWGPKMPLRLEDEMWRGTPATTRSIAAPGQFCTHDFSSGRQVHVSHRPGGENESRAQRNKTKQNKRGAFR
jgi:hypothetical protein